jgi:hypothetical protein
MKQIIAILALMTLSLSAIARDPILTCTIQNPKTKQKGTAKINLNKLENFDGMSTGIDSGNDNYSFNMSVEKIAKDYQLNIIFQENNNVQDEVGGKDCVYKLSKGTKSFCYETLTADNGWTVAIFYCQVK